MAPPAETTTEDPRGVTRDEINGPEASAGSRSDPVENWPMPTVSYSWEFIQNKQITSTLFSSPRSVYNLSKDWKKKKLIKILIKGTVLQSSTLSTKLFFLLFPGNSVLSNWSCNHDCMKFIFAWKSTAEIWNVKGMPFQKRPQFKKNTFEKN